MSNPEAASAAAPFGPAAAYERLIGRWSRALAPAFLDFAAIGPARDVLDLGCGTGALTGVLASRLPQACLTGLDLDGAYVRTCRSAWPASRFRFVAGDAACLPFQPASFDAVLSLLLLMLVPEPQRVAEQTARVLRPDGVAAAAVWDDAEFALIRGFWDEAQAVDPEASRHCGLGACARPGALAACWTNAGFVEVRESDVRLTMHFEDAPAIWSCLAAGVGPAGRFVQALPAARREVLAARLAARWSQEGLSFQARLLMVRGRRARGCARATRA